MRDILSEALLKASTPTSKPRKIEPSKTSRIDLYKFVGKDKDRPKMMGVYHDIGGWAIASDGRILIASRSEFRAEYAEKIIGKDGREINDHYPKWRPVIPSTDGTVVQVNADEIISIKKQMQARIKQDGLKPGQCSMTYKLGSVWYNLELLSKIAKFTPMLETLDMLPARYITDDLIVLVMPMLSQTEGRDLDPETYAILSCDGEVVESFARTAVAATAAEPKRKFNNLLAI